MKHSFTNKTVLTDLNLQEEDLVAQALELDFMWEELIEDLQPVSEKVYRPSFSAVDSILSYAQNTAVSQPVF